MALTHGYSLSHWQSSLQVLWEKKPRAIHIADLCALGLLEANFNAAMKILVGDHMVCQALQNNLIHLTAMEASPATMPSKCPLVTAYWMTSHAKNAAIPWL